MPAPFTRRRALTTFGSVSLAGILSACGESAPSGSRTSTSVTTEDGAGAAVSPSTRSARVTPELFDDGTSCALTAEATEGPFYFDVDAIRSDIRDDREGARLRLAVRVREAGSCAPLRNAVVDIWHCDAAGVYSGFESASRGGPGGGGRTDDRTYLRGAQVTDADGIVEFTTIYPGSYPGRTVHIHAKVHLDRTTLVTTQLYFDEAVTARVYDDEPYASGGGDGTDNDADRLFDPAAVIDVSGDGDGHLGVVTFDVRRA